jgi:hypothetical protein
MVAEIIEAPISSPEEYEKIRERTGLSGAPAGAVLHIAGPTDNGGWRIVTVWESRQAAARWGQKVRAARKDVGLEREATVSYFDVYSIAPSARG